LLIRLNKFLSQAGAASRREADRLIAEGRVAVNGEVVAELGQKIDDEKDTVELDGKRIIGGSKPVYILLYKPAGYIVSLKDPQKRPTVLDLLPPLKTRVFPVGRLDFESEGLLLLTNDGETANRLIHPRYKIRKEYVIQVQGRPDEKSLQKLRRGIPLDGRRTAPARVSSLVLGRKKSILKIEIHEGRKREIRRMLQAVGYQVLGLKRIRFAGLSLESLRPGEWRYLHPSEVGRIKKMVGLRPRS
jgi:pseudouridine synthase